MKIGQSTLHQQLPKQKTLNALSEWIAVFLQDLETHRQYSKHTVQAYRRDLKKFQHFTRDNTDAFSDLTTRTCKQFLIHLNTQKYTPKTVARLLATLRSFWYFLQQSEATENNPWAHIKSPKIQKKLPTVVSDNQLSVFLNSINTSTPTGCRDRAICELLYSSGIRVSECTQLNTNHLDLLTREGFVRGKGNKERMILFGATTATFLDQYISQARPLLEKEPTPALFLSTKGTRLTQRSIQRLIKTHTEACGLSQTITPHTLRHSYATELYNGGADLKMIQELLGHENISTTQLYTHLSSQRLIDVILKNHPRDDT